MLYYAIGNQVLPIQPLPREGEDFPRYVKYFNHVPLLTWLLDLSSPLPTALLYGPWFSAPGPRPSCSAGVHEISVTKHVT